VRVLDDADDVAGGIGDGRDADRVADVDDRFALGAAGVDQPVKARWTPDQPVPISYDCERVGRLSSSYADAALTAFHTHEARAAHEHDLGRFRQATVATGSKPVAS
jgi:hypothetical protein